MKIKIINPIKIVSRITQFYREAKLRKYDNSYGWDEVRKDIYWAQIDTNKLLLNTKFSYDPRSTGAAYTMDNIPPSAISVVKLAARSMAANRFYAPFVPTAILLPFLFTCLCKQGYSSPNNLIF